MIREQLTTISGLSHRRYLPRLGKIRLGIKRVSKKTQQEYPSEVPYFVCPPEVQKIYGQTPTEIDIMFPTENQEEFFPQSYKLYSKQALTCKGNGEIALRRWENCSEEQRKGIEQGSLVEVPCPCEKVNTDCSPVGNLMVLLPKVSIGGVYQIDTGSITNIITINSYIDYMRGITQGRVSLIPLKLRRIPKEMTFENNGKPQKSTHYLLQLELPLSLADIESLRKDKLAIIQKDLISLPHPTEDGKDYPEVIEVIDEENTKGIPTKFISENQRKRLFAIAYAAKVPPALIKHYLNANYHIEGSGQIPVTLYEEIISDIQSGKIMELSKEGDKNKVPPALIEHYLKANYHIEGSRQIPEPLYDKKISDIQSDKIMELSKEGNKNGDNTMFDILGTKEKLVKTGIKEEQIQEWFSSFYHSLGYESEHQLPANYLADWLEYLKLQLEERMQKIP